MFQIKNNGKVVTPKVTNVSDGQIVEFDYKPTKADQIIQLVHEDILDGSAHGYMGDYYFKQTMIWTGDPTMAYEKNTSEASRLKTIFDNLNNISLAMKDPGKSYGSFQINANGILTEFLNADGTLKTSTLTTAGKIINLIQGDYNTAIQQMSKDIYNVTVAKKDVINEINVQAGSTIFSAKDANGKNILQITPQTTYIPNATITNAMIKEMSADKLTAGTINANDINVINVNLQNLVGDFAQFMRTIWASITTQVYIDGGGIKIYRLDGTNSVDFTETGMEFRDHRGIKAGSIGWSKYAGKDYGALNLTALRGHSVALVSKRNGNSLPGVPELKVTGEGRIEAWSPIFHADSPWGVQIVGVAPGGKTGITLGAATKADRYGYIGLGADRKVYISNPGDTYTVLNDKFDQLDSRISSLASRVSSLESR